MFKLFFLASGAYGFSRARDTLDKLKRVDRSCQRETSMLHALAFGILMDDAIQRRAVTDIKGRDEDIS